MGHVQFSWKTRDGLTIAGRLWEPAEPCRAVVTLVHGVGEHSRRYAHVGEALNEAGYACVAFDHRGHGLSEGQKGYFPSYSTVIQDVKDHLEHTRNRYPDKPVFLYGHSMGGNLVINYTLRFQPEIRGVIATAPMLRLAFRPSRIKQILVNALIRLWPNLSLPSGLNTADISRDPEVVRLYDEDDLTHDRITPCFMRLLEAGEWALEHASEWDCPLLLMHGSEDHITSPENSARFAEHAGKSCTLRIWEGLYHEIHNEPEKDRVLKTLIDWLDRQMT